MKLIGDRLVEVLYTDDHDKLINRLLAALAAVLEATGTVGESALGRFLDNLESRRNGS